MISEEVLGEALLTELRGKRDEDDLGFLDGAGQRSEDTRE